MEKYSIIVAGGNGTRMQSAVPKQFLEINGVPIIILTLQKFLSIIDNSIVLVLPKSEFEKWNKISSEHKIDASRINIVEGGKTRFQSVNNGLLSIVSNDAVVAIHDAVRPFIDTNTIEQSFELAIKHKAVVVCVDSKDSIRYVDSNGCNKALDRTKVKIVQTPQTFEINTIRKAYKQPEESFFTDDASVVEHCGQEIHLIEGAFSNIKITTPEDLKIGEILIRNKTK